MAETFCQNQDVFLMSVFHIKFGPYQPGTSYIGGAALLDNKNAIPNIPDTEEKQKLLLTLRSDFFKSPLLKEDEVLSIFISHKTDSINITRDLAVNDSNQSENLKRKYATVLIHKINDSIANDSAMFPAASLSTTTFSEAELKEETATPGRGTEYSKLNGIPGWIQDDIFVEPRYGYWMQLNEYDLTKVSEAYRNTFREGIGYLFLNNNIKKMTITKEPQEAGIFFIQFS